MAGGMVVRELLARMGIAVDEGSVKKADDRIAKFAESAKHALEAYGVFKLYEFVKQKFEGIAETAAGLEQLAQKTGMTTEALQELQYAAKQSGVEAQELQMGLVHLSRSAFEAATQGGAAGAAFYRLGIQVRDGTGKLKSVNELFGEVADRLNAMPDGAEKSALSLELLSRSGANLIPLLNRGSAGIAKLGLEGKKTGGLLSEGMIKQGVELHVNLNKLGYVLNGLTYSVLGPFVKSVTRLVQGFGQWVVAHRQLIATHIGQVVRDIGEGFRFAGEMLSRFSGLFAFLGGVILLATSPLTFFIATLGLLAQDIWTYTQGGDSLFGRLIYFFEMLAHRVKKTFGEVRDELLNLIPQPLMDFLSGKSGGSGGGVGGAFGPTLSPATGPDSGVMSFLRRGANAVLGPPPSMAPQAMTASGPVTIHVTQLPGENGEDFAQRVARIVNDINGADRRAAASK